MTQSYKKISEEEIKSPQLGKAPSSRCRQQTNPTQEV